MIFVGKQADTGLGYKILELVKFKGVGGIQLEFRKHNKSNLLGEAFKLNSVLI